MVDALNWMGQFGWEPPPEIRGYWQVDVIIATRPPKEWVSRRHGLKPDDMWLSLTVSSFSPWVVRLKRHDALFTTWWSDKGIAVDSQQMRYRKLIQWPTLVDPIQLPILIERLNTMLQPGFSRHAEVRILQASDAVRQSLSTWLSPICESIDFIDPGR